MLYYEPMQIKTILHDYFLIFLLFNLVSCSSLESVPEFLPKVYKIKIQQGNEITSELLMKLKPGMTKSQVRFVLGTPLVHDTFHQERWDYVYAMTINDIVIEQRHVTLNFVDELLKNITGEVVPKSEDSKLSKDVVKTKKNLQLREKKGNNKPGVTGEEAKTSQSKKLPPLIDDAESILNKEALESVDISESINEAIRQDIIDSLPAKDDPGYFDLLLEKIGF